MALNEDPDYNSEKEQSEQEDIWADDDDYAAKVLKLFWGGLLVVIGGILLMYYMSLNIRWWGSDGDTVKEVSEVQKAEERDQPSGYESPYEQRSYSSSGKKRARGKAR